MLKTFVVVFQFDRGMSPHENFYPERVYVRSAHPLRVVVADLRDGFYISPDLREVKEVSDNDRDVWIAPGAIRSIRQIPSTR